MLFLIPQLRCLQGQLKQFSPVLSRDLREMKKINVISVLSLEAQLIANYIEAGFYFERVCEEINTDRKKEKKNYSP